MSIAQSKEIQYKGRFAPSPTGPLHLGSLVAAMASYLDARVNKGHWLLRIEDIDPPREIAGSTKQIISNLEQLGFEWDEEITYQSNRHKLYEQAVKFLLSKNLAYGCKCSRKEIAKTQLDNNSQLRYPGTCRQKIFSADDELAVRVITNDKNIHFLDRLTGEFSQNIHTETGDFVIRRKDGYYAYQLAVAVDDADQKITHVVRGEDLLDSTPRQIHLQQLLSLQTPEYAHTPLVLDKNGNKFSKSSNNGLPLELNLNSLLKAWHFLKQTPTNINEFDTIKDFWRWAIQQWDTSKLVKQHDK